MANYEIDEIRRIRQEISARFNHDAEKLGAYYRALDEEFRKAGYKFADLPPEKPEVAKPAKQQIDFKSLKGRVSTADNETFKNTTF